MGRTVGIDLGTTYSLVAYHGPANGRAGGASLAPSRFNPVPLGGKRR